MTKKNYVITTDKKLKGKHKINMDNKTILNPQEEIIAKEIADWEKKHKK